MEVGQKEFAYLTEDSRDTELRTYGMKPCIAIGLKDSRNQVVALSHLDQNYLDQAEYFIEEVLDSTGAEFEDSRVATLKSDREIVDEVVKYVELFCDSVEKVSGREACNLAVGLEEGFYTPETPQSLESSYPDTEKPLLNLSEVIPDSHPTVSP